MGTVEDQHAQADSRSEEATCRVPVSNSDSIAGRAETVTSQEHARQQTANRQVAPPADAMLAILRCLRRSRRGGSEIHAKSFAPYGHRTVFPQV
jgi:hypothetical protein